MSERSKGYIGQIVDGKKLATIANDIYRLQYSNDFSECTVDNLLFVTLEEKNVFGANTYALVCSECQSLYKLNARHLRTSHCFLNATFLL